MKLATNAPASAILPADADRALLVGRLWMPDVGPMIVGVRGLQLVDLTPLAPTMSQLLELDDLAGRVGRMCADAPAVASLEAVLGNADERRQA